MTENTTTISYGGSKWDIGGIQTVEGHGAITIPKRLRGVLDIKPGDSVHVGYEYDTGRRVMANSEIIDEGVNDVEDNVLRPENRVAIPGQMRVEKPGAKYLQHSWSRIRDDAKVEPGQTFFFVYPVIDSDTNWCYFIERETLHVWLSPSTESDDGIETANSDSIPHNKAIGTYQNTDDES